MAFNFFFGFAPEVRGAGIPGNHMQRVKRCGRRNPDPGAVLLDMRGHDCQRNRAM